MMFSALAESGLSGMFQYATQRDLFDREFEVAVLEVAATWSEFEPWAMVNSL